MDTLKEYKVRPCFSLRDMSNVPVKYTVAALNSYFNHPNEGSQTKQPEEEAIWFYLLNHAVGVVYSTTDDHEPLLAKERIMTMYSKKVSMSAIRMFYYLLLICTRESRHARSDTDWKKLQLKFGAPLINYTYSIAGLGSSGTVDSFRSHPPEFLIGEYTRYLVDLFTYGSFSGGFGGKAWAGIAEVLCKFVTGVFSAEMMLDTAYTLAHNNGPIFNKGMLYKGYNSYEILKVLDVQRSGQIPELVLDPEDYSSFVSKDHKKTATEILEILGSSFCGEYLDWVKVKELGAIGNYTDYIKLQELKYGVSKFKEEPKEYFEIPGLLKLEKVKRNGLD